MSRVFKHELNPIWVFFSGWNSFPRKWHTTKRDDVLYSGKKQSLRFALSIPWKFKLVLPRGLEINGLIRLQKPSKKARLLMANIWRLRRESLLLCSASHLRSHVLEIQGVLLISFSASMSLTGFKTFSCCRFQFRRQTGTRRNIWIETSR